jgi:chromate transport protein ChrA
MFWEFFKISLLSFGGGILIVLPEIERVAVVKYGWITREQLLEGFGIAQFVPGPSAAVMPVIGYWANGWPGFFACFLGAYTGPILLTMTIFWLYQKYRTHEWVRKTELSLRPIVLGLAGGSVLHFWWIQSGSSPHPYIFRLAAVLVTSTGYVFYFKKVVKGGLQLIFTMGGLWLIAKVTMQVVFP